MTGITLQMLADVIARADVEAEPARRVGVDPVIVPPALYDQALAAGLVHPDDPAWVRGSLKVVTE